MEAAGRFENAARLLASGCDIEKPAACDSGKPEAPLTPAVSGWVPPPARGWVPPPGRDCHGLHGMPVYLQKSQGHPH